MYFEIIDMKNARIKSTYSVFRANKLEVIPHWHGETEILLFLEGHCTQQIGGQYFFTFPGDIVVISKNQLHSTYSYQNSAGKILVILADSDLFFNHENIVFENPVNRNCPEYARLRESLETLHQEFTEKKEGYEYKAIAALYEFFTAMLRTVPHVQNDEQQNDGAKNILKNTFLLLEKNYSAPITLEDAAAASNLSVSHFCRLFKKMTGMTFFHYLQFYRINIAEKMLSSDRTVAQIAYECGFNSLPAFYRNFKKYKNYTPSENR